VVFGSDALERAGLRPTRSSPRGCGQSADIEPRGAVPRAVWETFSANAFVPLNACGWLGTVGRESFNAAVDRRRSFWTSVAERRRSWVHVRAWRHCAERNAHRPELVVGCVRLRTWAVSR